MKRLILAAGMLVSAAAHGQVAAVRAEQPWARATAPKQTVGGAYVALTSPVDDRLMGASSPAAGHVELHEMTMDASVMRMRELKGGLPLPAGKTVTLAPGGQHMMLVDLRGPLTAGQVIVLQLRFEHAAPVELEVPVAPVGASGPHRDHTK